MRRMGAFDCLDDFTMTSPYSRGIVDITLLQTNFCGKSPKFGRDMLIEI